MPEPIDRSTALRVARTFLDILLVRIRALQGQRPDPEDDGTTTLTLPDGREIEFDAIVLAPERIRVSCGWPSRSALSGKAKRIGEAWSHRCSADGSHGLVD